MERNYLATLLFTGLLLGLLMAWQFGTSIPIEGNFPSDTVTAREELLKSYLDEQSYLQSRIVSLRKEMEDTKSTLNSQSEKTNFEILDGLKAGIGLTEVSGPGLQITLNDSSSVIRSEVPASSEGLVQASDLRDVVNILNAADAEAISINNQRIISSSAISAVGTNVLVNNSHIAPPFVVDAVGDTEIMLQRLLNKNLLKELYEKTRKKKIFFEIYKKNSVTVPIYNGDLKTNYLNLVGE